MIKIRSIVLAAALTAPFAVVAGTLKLPSQEESEVIAMMQVADTQIGVHKRAVVAEQLALSPEQAERFWPVYEAHQKALSTLNRRRLDNILIYARAWSADSVDDRTAAEVAREAIAVEEEEARLLKRTFRKACKVVPAAQAARYLQLEVKVRARMHYAETASVPLVK